MEEENKVTEEVKEEVKEKSKLPIIIIVIVLLVAVGLGGFFIAKKMYDKPNNDTKEETKKEETNTEDNNEEKKEFEEPEVDPNNMVFTKDGIEVVGYGISIADIYPKHYYYSFDDVKETGECYIDNSTATQPDIKLKDNCEETYEFLNIKDRKAIFTFKITNGEKQLYYNGKEISAGSIQLIKIDNDYYFVMLDGYSNGTTIIMDLDGNYITEVPSRSEVVFTKLNGKPIIIYSYGRSDFSFEETGDDLDLRFVFVGGSKVHELHTKLEKDTYVDVMLTAAVW